MRRVFALAVLLAPALFVPLGSGCSEEKTTTIERSETVQESEPRMVSPGKEVVE